MLITRTFGFMMKDARLWLILAGLNCLLLGVSCAHHRRSMPTPTTYPLSKGGWKPVINSGLPGYGAFAAAPLHAQPYKIPIAVAVDNYPSSSRPLSTRDATKLTSIAQSYRPTTLRTMASTSPAYPQGNQPINSYYNPFGHQNSGGLSHFKIVQNFPGENVVIRNPHNPYAARPVYKYPPKFKQQYHNSVLQQLNNVQPIQFAVPVYPTTKQQQQHQQHQQQQQPQQHQQQQQQQQQQVDQYGRPVQESKRHQFNSGTEIFKPEVYKVPSDSDTAPQSVSQQQVKTAQQQTTQTLKPTGGPYPQYQFQDEKFAPLPPSILGTFSSYGVQSIKGRDPFQQTKTTYIPSQPTKQTIFNSFSFAPYFKTTPSHFPVTTPKFQTALNQIHYGNTLVDYKATSVQPPKVIAPQKIDPNAGKPNFKPSPQDPFSKHQQTGDQNKVSTYNPNNVQTTTANSYFFNSFNDRYPSQYNQNLQNPYYINNQHANYDNKKANIHDSIPNNQQSSVQYAEPPKRRPQNEATQNSLPVPATYEVTETYESDIVSNSSPNSWSAITDSYDQGDKQLKPSDDPVNKDEYSVNYDRLPTTQPTDLVDEYAIVTESDKGYENSLGYDSHVETQSRRPLGDSFEPINKHKLKDYYYRVSTPSHEDNTHYRKKGKPTEASINSEESLTTHKANDDHTEALPTLPPNRHFKRPNAPEAIDKDKIRKRNKIRRRRPIGNKQEETTTRKTFTEGPTTESEDNHTIKPRPRATKPKSALTTPTTSTDLSTSALPTISPTSPTVVKKKLSHRRPQSTTTERVESTTFAYKEFDPNKESPIMKIATRPQHPRVTTATYDQKTSETPDYSHKQDEKDTPTSDIAVNLSDTLKTKPEPVKQFSFHKDVKPLDAKLEVIRLTTEGYKDSTEEASEYATSTGRVESASESPGKIQRPRLKNNKYENNRPKFSVKDYRNRLSSTTTTDKPTDSVPIKFKFPQRRVPLDKYNNDNETVDRKKFTPKDPRHKSGNNDDEEGVTEREVHSTRQPTRQRHTSTTESGDGTPKISSRIRNGSRRPKPTEEPTETSSPTTVHIKRPLRKKIMDSEIGESVQDLSVTETTVRHESKDDITSERTRSESAIMKIAKDDKKHQTEHLENAFEHSKRVSDLTLAASKDYNTPGMFKTVSPNSRRIPNYFTIATDDPILPIEAFFPQLNQKKES